MATMFSNKIKNQSTMCVWCISLLTIILGIVICILCNTYVTLATGILTILSSFCGCLAAKFKMPLFVGTFMLSAFSIMVLCFYDAVLAFAGGNTGIGVLTVITGLLLFAACLGTFPLCTGGFRKDAMSADSYERE